MTRPTNPVRDVLGRPIGQGDVITYPGRKSSHLYVHVGIVVAAGEGNARVISAERSWRRPGEWDVSPRISTIHVLERATIVDPSAVTADARLLAAISAAYKRAAGGLPPWHPDLTPPSLDETIPTFTPADPPRPDAPDWGG